MKIHTGEDSCYDREEKATAVTMSERSRTVDVMPVVATGSSQVPQKEKQLQSGVKHFEEVGVGCALGLPNRSIIISVPPADKTVMQNRRLRLGYEKRREMSGTRDTHLVTWVRQLA